MNLLIVNQKTKKVGLQGVDQPEADLIAYNNDLLVIKVPGFSYWVGRCLDRGYACTEYQIFRAASAISNSVEVSVSATKLLSFPARKGEDTENISDVALKNLFNLVTLSGDAGFREGTR